MNRISHYLLSLRLRNKFIFSIILITFLSGTVTIVFVHQTLSQTLESELQNRGVVITKNLASNSVDPLLKEDIFSIQRLLSRVKDAEEDVSYVFITGPSGSVVAHTFEGGFPAELLNANDVPSNLGHQFQLLDTEEGFIRDTAVPILEGKAGTVHVGMSESRIRAEVLSASKALMVITFFVMINGIFLAYFAGKLITGPIYALQKGAEEVGKGNLDYRIDVSSSDEISILSGSFNQMALNLRESTDKIKKYSMQLELEVEERTKELLLLQKINNMLNAGSSQDEIFKTITEGLTSIYGYDLSAIYLLNEEGTHLICRGYSADLKIVRNAEKLTGITALNFSVPLYSGSILSKVVEKREPVITKDIVELIRSHTEERRLKMLGRPLAKLIGIKYGIGVPLLAGDGLVGTIGVGSKEKLTKKDADTLKNFAEQVGLAVRKVKMEHELKDYSEKLEQKVEEKTKQVIHSEKLASLGQLAAGVAHEINNPLTNILLEAEALRDRQMNDETRKETLEDIISQADDAARIVKNLVEFSRQSEPNPVPVDIRDILNNSMRMASHELKNIKIKKMYPSKLQKINGDPNQLKQVFLNIFLNSIQAMPNRGKIEISVRVTSGFIETDISDDGTGILKEILDKIFDPFFTTKKVGEGTGLGLSICLGIVERHGGQITVRSKEGSGSTFTVKLPVSS